MNKSNRCLFYWICRLVSAFDLSCEGLQSFKLRSLVSLVYPREPAPSYDWIAESVACIDCSSHLRADRPVSSPAAFRGRTALGSEPVVDWKESQIEMPSSHLIRVPIPYRSFYCYTSASWKLYYIWIQRWHLMTRLLEILNLRWFRALLFRKGTLHSHHKTDICLFFF